jgi:hypothetical protein
MQNFGAQSHGLDARCQRFQLRFPYTGMTRFRLVAEPLPDGLCSRWSSVASFKAAFRPSISKASGFSLSPSYRFAVVGFASVLKNDETGLGKGLYYLLRLYEG